MKLRDLFEKIEGGCYLLSIYGICEELPCDCDVLDCLREKDYYKESCDRKVKGISVAVKNMRPELRITLEK